MKDSASNGSDAVGAGGNTSLKQASVDITELLQTPYEDIFKLTTDGTTYIKPASLRGVRVAKLTEDSDDWNPAWISLNRYLSREAEEEQLKADTRQRLQLDPSNRSLAKAAKLHQDNVSKHRKIRDIFGPQQQCHPNQVVSRRHLPAQGLCEQEIMYLLGCKMSDLQRLADVGKLAMEPWDFLRWRIGELLLRRKKKSFPGGNDDVKKVIHNIVSESSEDPLFRQIILYSARLGGRYYSFGPRKKDGEYRIHGKGIIARLASRPAAPTRRGNIETAQDLKRMEEFRRRRAEHRARLAQNSSGGYQGVNAYRQRMGSSST